MPDTEWTTEDVLYLPLEKCTERPCPKLHYSELTDDENTRWHAMSSVHLTSLAAHDAEVAAKALEAMGEFFRMASQLGTGERDEIAAQACFDRAAALRGEA